MGGLGIQAAKAKNIDNLAKLNCRLRSEPLLVGPVLNHKYRNPGRTLNLRTFRSACSVTWSAIRKGEGVFYKGSKWIAGKNSHLSLWFDKWLDRGTLRSLIEGPLNQGEEHITLQDIAGFSGWN